MSEYEYFVSYCAYQQGLSVVGNASIQRSEPITCIFDLMTVARALEKNRGLTRMEIINWQLFPLAHTTKEETARPTLQKMVCADTATLLSYSVNELLEIGWRVIQIGEFGKQAWALLERTPASPLAGEGLV